MDVEKFLKKAYILGGHCPHCNGFLFTEVSNENPLQIQQRCLKCERVKIIFDDDERLVRSGYLYYSCRDPIGKILR